MSLFDTPRAALCHYLTRGITAMEFTETVTEANKLTVIAEKEILVLCFVMSTDTYVELADWSCLKRFNRCYWEYSTSIYCSWPLNSLEKFCVHVMTTGKNLKDLMLRATAVKLITNMQNWSDGTETARGGDVPYWIRLAADMAAPTDDWTEERANAEATGSSSSGSTLTAGATGPRPTDAASSTAPRKGMFVRLINSLSLTTTAPVPTGPVNFNIVKDLAKSSVN